MIGPSARSSPRWHDGDWAAIWVRMCGRVIQSSGPLRYSMVDGMNVRDSRVHNYPPRWNAAPSQDLLVIRRNHRTGAVSLDPLRWGLIPNWCNEPQGGRKPINAKCEGQLTHLSITSASLATYGRAPAAMVPCLAFWRRRAER